MKKQLHEANDSYAIARKKREEEHACLMEAKQKISSLNKRRVFVEEEIERQERNNQNMKKVLGYKLKVCAANTNLCLKAGAFDKKIKFVETNIKTSREKLNGWQQKLSAVVADYKDKRNRLEDIQRRKKESHGCVNALQSDLSKMKQRIKVLNGKKSFRKIKFEATEDEMDYINHEILDAESRQMLSEQHLLSLGIYEEALQNEFDQQRKHTQNIIDKLAAVKLMKREKLQSRNITATQRVR